MWYSFVQCKQEKIIYICKRIYHIDILYLNAKHIFHEQTDQE